MFNFDVKINDEQARKVLDATAKHLLDLTPENKQAAAFINSKTQQHFNNAEGPDGAWKPRKSTKGTWPLLQKTKALRRDVVADVNTKIGKLDIAITSSLPYAATHQFGDDSRNIPSRPYTWLSKSDIKQLEQLYAAGF